MAMIMLNFILKIINKTWYRYSLYHKMGENLRPWGKISLGLQFHLQ
jgi:hypothetical protein